MVYEKINNQYKITLDNNKVIFAQANYIDTQARLLNDTIENIIDMFLFDNDYISNTQVEELTQKAKDNKIKNVVASEKKKNRKPRQLKENHDKIFIIEKISELLQSLESVSNATVVNKGKIIEFTINGNNYKIDLVQHRNKKE